MKKRLLIFTVILTLLCGTLVAYQALGDSRRGGTVTISREEYDRLAQYAKLDEVLQYIQAYCYQEPDTDAMMDMAVQGLLAGLEDTYTFYYDTESWSDLWSEEEGEYTGIGIQLLAITAITPSPSPAYSAIPPPRPPACARATCWCAWPISRSTPKPCRWPSTSCAAWWVKRWR